MGRIEVILDTHIWIWWIHAEASLPEDVRSLLQSQSEGSLAISAISLWEVSKLVERRRLDLPLAIGPWMDMALGGSAISVVPISPAIAIDSSSLPGTFHRDPADQLIVATARILDRPLVTCDQRIRAYPNVRLLTGSQVQDR